MRRGSWQQGRNGALGIAFALGLAACGGGDSSDQLNNGTGATDPNAPGSVNPSPGGSTPGGGTGGGATPTPTPVLDTRVVDYGEALRIASLKLTGDLPTLDQINEIGSAADAKTAKAAYEKDVDAMIADKRFTAMMIQWWRDTLKTGGPPPAMGMPSFDTAATFAAEVVINDRPYSDLFTAATNTCPTYTAATNAFADAACTGTQPTAGLLSDPGIQAQYFSNMAMRRTRFIQETFVCSKMPAEFSSTPKAMGAGSYTSPWNFNSITGGTTAKINFLDTSAVICANCHTTMNHMAPLLGHFDGKGVYDGTKFAVLVPVPGNPAAQLQDWLPASEGFAWRNGVTVTDIPSLGAAIAKDPVVATCAVNRVWNWAMSRGDVVNDLATVPLTVTQQYVADFNKNGQKLKATIAAVYKSDDFVKF